MDQMNHSAYQNKVRKMETSSLQFTIKDCKEAILANPDNPKNGYYQDEISYCSAELHRRQTK